MNVLLLGSGGREFTFAWKFKQSPLLTNLYIAPGNGGTDQFGENLAINPEDFLEVKTAILRLKIDLVVVGPEAPLVAGLKDQIKADQELQGVLVLGPDKFAAALEGSKDFAKQFMVKYGIPTSAYKTFTAETLEQGYQFLDALSAPYVLKADGLAGGKGVLIIQDLTEAKQELKSMLTESKFGKASQTVVIEEFLEGVELSIFTLTDGKNYVVLPEAKDYKRIHDGDKGLNTGGMGAVSPVPFAQGEFLEKVNEKIIKPTMAAIAAEGYDYSGFVFFGLINKGGEPFVIEYNVRMGDPETEVVLPRVKTDMVEIFEAISNKSLDKINIEIDDRAATTVMLVSGGYPEAYERGKEITGLENIKDSIPFHAGSVKSNGEIITSGGRVMAITSYGNTYQEAIKRCYKNISKLKFEKMCYRKDIGFDL